MKACRKKKYNLLLIQLLSTVYAAYSSFVHKRPDPTQMKQEFKHLRPVYVLLGAYFCIKTCLLEVLFLVK